MARHDIFACCVVQKKQDEEQKTKNKRENDTRESKKKKRVSNASLKNTHDPSIFQTLTRPS